MRWEQVRNIGWKWVIDYAFFGMFGLRFHDSLVLIASVWKGMSTGRPTNKHTRTYLAGGDLGPTNMVFSGSNLPSACTLLVRNASQWPSFGGSTGAAASESLASWIWPIFQKYRWSCHVPRYAVPMTGTENTVSPRIRFHPPEEHNREKFVRGFVCAI
jgi:hypothetical protein